MCVGDPQLDVALCRINSAAVHNVSYINVEYFGKVFDVATTNGVAILFEHRQ